MAHDRVPTPAGRELHQADCRHTAGASHALEREAVHGSGDARSPQTAIQPQVNSHAAAKSTGAYQWAFGNVDRTRIRKRVAPANLDML